MRHLKRIIICSMLIIIAFFAYADKADIEAASGSYYIKINKGTNVVTVYKSNGDAFKAFTCSTGTATPTGTFYTPAKYRWKELMGPSYGQYCTRITGGILFHSVWYYKNGDKSTMANKEYNKLGTTCSHGCVRLRCADSKWIYDNCSIGTKVIIFNGKSSDDPLGKPSYTKVSTSSKMGWDPTDPDTNNPYLKPTLSGVAGSKTVQYNTTVNILKNVSSKSSKGVNLTSKIVVTIKKPGAKSAYTSKASTMKLNKLGKYTITYKVTDPKLKNTRTKTITYTVVDTKPVTFTGITASKIVNYKSSMDIRTKVKAKNATGTSCKITITVKAPGASKASTVYGNKLSFLKKGKYVVTYKAYNPNCKKYTTKAVTYTSGDTVKPTISGASSKTKEYGTKYNVKTGVTAKTTISGNLTSKIKVTVKDPSKKAVTVSNNYITLNKLGKYTITYTVANSSNVSNSKTITITVTDTKAPSITAPATLSGQYGNTFNVLSGVSANTAAKQNITSKITATVVDIDGVNVTLGNNTFTLEKEKYIVTYKVTGYNGKTATIKRTITVSGVPSNEPVVTPEPTQTPEESAEANEGDNNTESSDIF